MADKLTPEKCPKPTIAEVLAKNSQEQCPLYDEHIFDEPYDDFIRADVDKRHEERVKARQQGIKEEEKRLEELLTEKIEELRKIAKEKRPGKGKEKGNQKKEGSSDEDNDSKDRELQLFVAAEMEGYRDFANMFKDMVNVAPPGVMVNQPEVRKRLQNVKERMLAGKDALDLLRKGEPK